jgi:hypothetical protein
MADVFEVVSVYYNESESIVSRVCEVCCLPVVFKFVCEGWHSANVRGTLCGKFTLLKNV